MPIIMKLPDWLVKVLKQTKNSILGILILILLIILPALIICGIIGGLQYLLK